jgi:hypothetical protein
MLADLPVTRPHSFAPSLWEPPRKRGPSNSFPSNRRLRFHASSWLKASAKLSPLDSRQRVNRCLHRCFDCPPPPAPQPKLRTSTPECSPLCSGEQTDEYILQVPKGIYPPGGASVQSALTLLHSDFPHAPHQETTRFPYPPASGG